MPILRPDEYKHGNVNLAFLDSDFVRGGIRVVASTANLTDSTMEGKVDQLKDNATLVYVTASSVFYRLKSKADVTSLANGWEEIDLTGTDGIDGNTILSGSAAPVVGDGENGDFFIDTSNNNIYGPKSSGAWPNAVSLVGQTGQTGPAATIAAGTATSVGSGASPSVTNSGTSSAATFDFEIPSGVAGIDGDGFTGGSYDSATGVVTFASNDGLGFTTSDLRGQPGNNGLPGDDGKTVLSGGGAPAGGLGSNGDFYIDTTNEDIYGPKTGGNTWGNATSLIGSTGQTGPTGPGYSAGSYNSSTGVVTLTGSGGSANVVTGDLRGGDGDDGAGYSSGAYNSSTGVVTFTGTGGNSNVITGDLRGEDGGAYAYTNASTMPEAVGGISAGTSFSASSLDSIFNALLYPYQAPAFSGTPTVPFSLSAKEVGQSVDINGNYSFALTNSSNVDADTLDLKTGSSYNTTEVIFSGQSINSPYSLTGESNISYNVKTRRYFRLFADNTNGVEFGSNSRILDWYWRVFWGESTSTSLNEDGIEGLNSSLEGDNLDTYDFAALDQGYKYFAFPPAYPAPSSFKDADSNTDIPLVGSSADGTYNNEDSNGNFYAEVSVTNSHSVTANYRVYRSFNALGGALSIIAA